MKKILSLFLILATVLSFSVVSFADTIYYPSTGEYQYGTYENGNPIILGIITDEMREVTPYFIMKDGLLFGFKSKPTVDYTSGWDSEDTDYSVTFSGADYVRWHFNSAETLPAHPNTWSIVEEYNDDDLTAYNKYIFWSSFKIELASDDRVVSNGDPNFFTLMELVTDHLERVTVPTVGGAMKILTVCGVGLIASLVALNLFGKVLRRFLG